MKNEESFKQRGSSIMLWQIRSKELYDAAEVVWNSKIIKIPLGNGEMDEMHELYRPAVLLMGLSLESLIKGLLIQNDDTLIDNGKIDNKIKTHDLASLFKKSGINISKENEINFLDRLTANVIWASKYAIPTKIISSDSNKTVSLLARNDGDFEIFKKLYSLVKSKYKEAT